MREQLLDVFRRTLELAEANETISRENCIKWDSMNHLNLIVEMETEFNIKIEPEEIFTLGDFSSFEKMILEKTNNKIAQ